MSNLQKAKKSLPKNLKYDAVLLGRRAFLWAAETASREGLKCNYTHMRSLIRKQCTMIYVKKIALAIIDDCEEASLNLYQTLKERKVS